MKKKFIKRVLITVGATMGMTAMSGAAAEARSNPELIIQRKTATELAGVTAKTKSNWLWSIGEGTTEGVTESYEIRRSNSFFQSVEIPPRADQLFNRNNNIGDPLPEYGQLELLRF